MGFGSDETEPRHKQTRKLSRPRPAPVGLPEGIPTPLLRIEPLAAEPTAWLCSATAPPIPLGAPRVVAGRQGECELVLPHKSVSRRHGMLKTRGQVVVYEDLGSSNGSFVNGTQLEPNKPRVLRVNDKLSIGPYAFHLRAGPDEMLETSGERMLQRMQTGAPPALVGKIREVPLAEVIQGIEFGKKTCRLEVESGELRGSLIVRAGRPLTASWGQLRDEQAVLAMLTLERGQFYLTNQAEVVADATMGTGLKLLLFEAARLRDEAGDDYDTAQF